MFHFTTKLAAKMQSACRPANARLQLENLEGREMPATLVTPPHEIGTPDSAGGTLPTARVISLPDFGKQAANDSLPSPSDVDLYRVTLGKGDYLAVDVSRTSSVALNNSLAVLNNSGAVVAGSLTASAVQVAAPFGFYAAEAGTYYVRLQSTSAADPQRSYNLTLERVAREDTNANPAGLQQGGAYHAWLNQSGDTLYVTGPTGYGFALRGNWVKTGSGSTISYAASGKMYLQTSYLSGSVGEIPLQVARTFTITTNAPGRAQLGELTGISGQFGLSLQPLAADIMRVFHMDVSGVALLSSWTIKTGTQIKHEYQNFAHHDIAQVLDGVPYLVYGDPGKLKVNFGKVNFTSGDQSSLVLIADPADPFLYVGYKNYAAAGSLNGHIPFNTTATLPAAPTGPLGVSVGRVGGEFGHVYVAGDFPVYTYGDPDKAAVQVSVAGDITVNLDANHDGRFLGGSGNASQFLHGDLSGVAGVLADVNIGSNGAGLLHVKVKGYDLQIPVAQASVFYSGTQKGVAFTSTDGTALHVWQNTVLKDFESGPGTTFQGYVMEDGRFSISTTGSYRLFGSVAALTLTVTDHDISARGTVTTPIGTANVVGTINPDGTFVWTGTAHVHIGGSSTFLDGNAAFIMTKTGAGLLFDADLNCQGRVTIGAVRADGTVTGHLKLLMNGSGHLTYDVASLRFAGGVYTYNPFTHDWNKITRIPSASISLNGNRLSFNAGGYGFSIDLP